MNLPAWLPVPAIILLALFGALLVYFIIGSLVRYHKGMRHFPEVLPNYRCWCGLCGGCIVCLTCGRCRPRYTYMLHTHGSDGVYIAGLPHRPNDRHLAFEALQSDWDEEYAEEGGIPAAAVRMRV